MVEIRIDVPNSSDVRRAVEAAAEALGLRVSVRTSHVRHPGSTHWHLKRGRESGTLEVTWSPSAREARISYHSNRIGNGWVAAGASELAALISVQLSANSGI